MLFFYEGNSLKSGIYEIRNRYANRSYIGQAKEIKERWKNHSYYLKTNRSQNKFLQNDFNKCKEILGHFNFLEFHILEIINGDSTKNERNIREEFWINEYLNNSYKLYNFILEPTKECGEKSCWSKNPEETRRKHSESSKLMWQNEEFKKNIGQKISESKKGKTWEELYTKEGAEKHRKKPSPMFGKHHTKEAKERLMKVQMKVYNLFLNPLLSPNNEEFQKIEGLRNFARIHNLNFNHLRAVINGVRKTHKGWKLKNINPT